MHPSARDYLEDVLSPSQLAQDGIFDHAAVAKLVAKFRSGAAIGIKDNMSLVGIISTQLLLNQFVNGFEARNTSNETRVTQVCH
jgi:hypothetical protein